MLGLGIGARRPMRWWPEGALYAADFVNNRYMRNGAEISRASAFTFSRASTKLAEDSRGVWQHFGVDEPAITDRGLLLEPAATNMVPNPIMAGAIVGTVGAGGALPTGWSTTAFTIVDVLDTGWEDGLPYITLRLRYTNSGSTTQYPLLIVAANVPATIGEQWTASVFYKLLAGAWHPNPAALLNVRETGTTQTYATLMRVGDMLTRTRRALSWTISRPGDVALELRAAMFNVLPAEGLDATARIYSPTLMAEQGAGGFTLQGSVRQNDVLSINLPVGAAQLRIAFASGVESSRPAIAGGNIIPPTLGDPIKTVVAI